MSSKTSPDEPANASQPSSMAPDESTPETAMPQERPAAEAINDSNFSPVTEDSEIRLPDGERDGRESLELPILPPEGDDGPDSVRAPRELPSEIPDTDAPSPWTSPVKEVRGQEVGRGVDLAAKEVDIGGEGGSGQEAPAVVEGERNDMMMDGKSTREEIGGAAATARVGEAALKEPTLASEGSASAELRPDAGSKDGDLDAGVSSASREAGDSCESPTYFGSNIVSYADEPISNQQKALLLSHLFAVEVPEAPAADEAQESTSVEAQLAAANEEVGSEDRSDLPTDKASHPESPQLDEVDMLIVEDSLPTKKTSFLQKALQADEALSVQEASTSQQILPPEIVPSRKALARTEIPPSDDDEDAMDEETDPSANIFEFHTTHGSASEDLDTFFMNVEATKQSDESIPAPTSTADTEAHIGGEASSWMARDAEVVDAPLSTDAAETTTAPISLSELLQPSVTVKAPLSESLEVDAPAATLVEWNFSSLIELPTSSVNLQDPNTTLAVVSSGEMDVEFPDAPFSTKESEEPTGVPMSSKDPPGVGATAASSAPATDLPKSEHTSTQPGKEGPPEIAASWYTLNEQAPQESPLAEENQLSVASSLQPNDDDPHASEVSSSPPKPKESSVAPWKPTTTPKASFAAPKGLVKEEASVAASKNSGKGKTSSTATNQSQSQTKGRSTPRKTDTGKDSAAAPDESPKKDVLFEELKAMKIVCLAPRLSFPFDNRPFAIPHTNFSQASIQARNASLEAEIGAKRAKLEEVTKELEWGSPCRFSPTLD